MIERRRAENVLLATNVTVRLAYGLGGVLAPEVLAKLRFAPPVEDRPDARLFVRGFSAHLLGVGVLGLVSLRRPGLRRAAAAAAVAIDLADIFSAVIEAIDRGRLDSELLGGILFSGAGAISAAATLR